MLEPWLMSARRELLEVLSRATSPSHRPRAVIIDWESGGKYARQASSEQLIGLTTNLDHDDRDGVEVARRLGFDRVICRINAFNEGTAGEVEDVIAQGGTDVLLPMWRTMDELRGLKDLVRGRAQIGVMIETADAVSQARQLHSIRPSFAFIGLMDLAIDRGTTTIFNPIVDGTLDKVADDLGDIPFGFGGLTVPDKGEPIPSRLFVGEMLRLGAAFSVMRRSFFRDVPLDESSAAIASIGAAITRWSSRSSSQIEQDRRDLQVKIRGMS